MPRELVVGNGQMLVTFDSHLNMRDFYFPYVGQLNHIMGHKNRIGLWTEGRFQWLEDDSWTTHLGYVPESLVTAVTSVNKALGIRVFFNDAVHYRHNLFLRRAVVKNQAERSREIRLFFSHDFSINQTDVGDTALYDPEAGVIIHYKLGRVFLISAFHQNQDEESPFYQYATGTKRFGGAEGTWRDAEDGVLEGNPIAQGSVDSVVSFSFQLGPLAEAELWYWIAAGESWDEVRFLDTEVRQTGLDALLHETQVYWQTWVNKNETDFADLPKDLVDLYKRSLLTIRTQVDAGGAIIAANDSDIIMTNRDHYSYMWPRDGALVAYALDTAGYHGISKAFFRFCAHLLSPGGFFWHKYNPDGSVGSSWHPWVKDGEKQLPIQEDETALVLWALGHHYRCTRDLEFIQELYDPLVRRAADFLVAYQDPVTYLPRESYDLWEERRGIFTFTSAAVSAALEAAGQLSRLFGHYRRALRYERAAKEVREAILTYLYDEEKGRFLRGVYQNGSKLIKDYTLESSLMGVAEFGVLPPTDPKVVSTMRAIKEGLWVKTAIGGVARYTNDYYHQVSQDIPTVPGNPWFICTLWVACWLADSARSLRELEQVTDLLAWSAARSTPPGLMAEQVHPYTGEGLSVAPLTWSHSTYVLAVHRYLAKHKALVRGQESPEFGGKY
ncbi:MAG: glycoside hydrolase family 15 protein [Firmicutes bacterium]|nr:glycoside hydrolase family 15 protein [Bacillota bacterium]